MRMKKWVGYRATTLILEVLEGCERERLARWLYRRGDTAVWVMLAELGVDWGVLDINFHGIYRP